MPNSRSTARPVAIVGMIASLGVVAIGVVASLFLGGSAPPSSHDGGSVGSEMSLTAAPPTVSARADADAALATAEDAAAALQDAPTRELVAVPDDSVVPGPRALVRVVDARGSPAAGILVSLVPSGSMVLTNDSGEAIFTGINLDPVLSKTTDESPFVAQVESELPAPCEIVAPRAAFLAGGVTLTLPRLAEVTVEIRRNGVLYPDPVPVSLAELAPKPTSGRDTGRIRGFDRLARSFQTAERRLVEIERVRNRGTARDGVARFANVESGIRCVAIAVIDGVEHRSHRTDVDTVEPIAAADSWGVTSADRTLVIRIDVAPFPTYRVRLLGLDGEPLRNRRIETRRWADSSDSGDSSTRSRGLVDESNPDRKTGTDGEGILRVEWNDAPLDASSRWLLFRSRDDWDTGWTPLDVTSRSAAIEHDVGDVRLLPVDRLTAGRVVDEAGRPVPGARIVVEVQSMRAADWDRRIPSSDELAGMDRTPAPLDLGLSTVNDNTGRFVIRGTAIGSILVATATVAGGGRSPSVPFRPLQSDLVLVVTVPGSISGSIDLWEGADPKLLRVRFGRSDAASTERTAAGVHRLDERGTGHVKVRGTEASYAFKAALLDPGEWTCRVLYGAKELLVVPGIVVHSNETTIDPRLQNVRLVRPADDPPQGQKLR